MTTPVAFVDVLPLIATIQKMQGVFDTDAAKNGDGDNRVISFTDEMLKSPDWKAVKQATSRALHELSKINNGKRPTLIGVKGFAMSNTDRSPASWQQHWASMPNSVNALYARFKKVSVPFVTFERRIEAWGQLCFDNAACNAVAYHMYNHGMRTGYKFISWRCEMDGEPVGGGKLSGSAPLDFDIHDYVPRR